MYYHVHVLRVDSMKVYILFLFWFNEFLQIAVTFQFSRPLFTIMTPPPKKNIQSGKYIFVWISIECIMMHWVRNIFSFNFETRLKVQIKCTDDMVTLTCIKKKCKCIPKKKLADAKKKRFWLPPIFFCVLKRQKMLGLLSH